MLCEIILELVCKSVALAVTVWAAHFLTSQYLEALIDFTRMYITVVDLLYAEGRLPTRL